MRRRLCTIGILASLWASFGCAAAPHATPRATLDAFVTAARRDDLTAIRRLVAGGEDGLVLEARAPELHALVDEVVAALEAGRTPVAVIARPSLGVASAVEETTGWRVADPGFGDRGAGRIPGREGARAAIRGLHESLQQGGVSWAGLLSARARGALDADLRALFEATEHVEWLDIPEGTGPLWVRLPDGRGLVLVWEDGGWRVDGLRDDGP